MKRWEAIAWAIIVPMLLITASSAQTAESTVAKHYRSVETFKLGEKTYTPGTVFYIRPLEDVTLTKDSYVKFECKRIAGAEPQKYRHVTVIVARVNGEEMFKQSSPYLIENGTLAAVLTWSTSQKEKELSFPVFFSGAGLYDPKITGKGYVYFYLDDGLGKVLSNITCIEANVEK
jgi:hypothetical protein